MNELTREASKQAILERISFLWLGGRGKVRKSRREPQRPLAGHFDDYLTGLEPSAEILDDFDFNYMPFKWKGVDLGKLLRKECEEIDRGVT